MREFSRKRTVLVAISLLAGCDTAGFKRTYMALDSQGQRKRDTFFTDSESIFCVAELASGVEDTTVHGVFDQRSIFLPENGQKVDFRQQIGSAELAPGKGEELIASFELKRTNAEDPYLAGEYGCLLYLNGELESALSFQVLYPSCPLAPVQPGFRCAGFVLDGKECTGATGRPCQCGPSGVWECS
jgi:hypothetical protein